MDLYFNASFNNDWNNLLNWFEDAEYLTAASSLPGSGDTVYIYGSVGYNGGGTPTITDLHVYDYDFSISITVSGIAYFYGVSNFDGAITGNAALVYPKQIYLGGTVTGTIDLADYPESYLFWRDATASGLWEDAGNWYTDLNGETLAGDYPWAADDGLQNYNLLRSKRDIDDGGLQCEIIGNIGDGFSISGVCDIGYISNGSLVNSGVIYNGTFSGLNFYHSAAGVIYGGSFLGGAFTTEPGSSIDEGYFPGDDLQVYSGIVNGGAFIGGNAVFDDCDIYGGIFSGTGPVFSYSNIYYADCSADGIIFDNVIFFNGTVAGPDATFTGSNIKNGLFQSDLTTLQSSQIYGGDYFGVTLNIESLSDIFSGSFRNSDITLDGYYIYGGLFAVGVFNFTDLLGIQGGAWLLDGMLNYNGNEVYGGVSNPLERTSEGSGFVNIVVPFVEPVTSDILGTGLL